MQRLLQELPPEQRPLHLQELLEEHQDPWRKSRLEQRTRGCKLGIEHLKEDVVAEQERGWVFVEDRPADCGEEGGWGWFLPVDVHELDDKEQQRVLVGHGATPTKMINWISEI